MLLLLYEELFCCQIRFFIYDNAQFSRTIYILLSVYRVTVTAPAHYQQKLNFRCLKSIVNIGLLFC